MFQYFFESSGTIVNGVGFSHFEMLHLAWLPVFVGFCGLSCYLYKKRSPEKRKRCGFFMQDCSFWMRQSRLRDLLLSVTMM